MLAPARSALVGLCFQPNSFRHFPNGSSAGMEFFQLAGEMGSARASRAVRRALAANISGAMNDIAPPTNANDEGVVGCTRGACAPQHDVQHIQRPTALDNGNQTNGVRSAFSDVRT